MPLIGVGFAIASKEPASRTRAGRQFTYDTFFHAASENLNRLQRDDLITLFRWRSRRSLSL